MLWLTRMLLTAFAALPLVSVSAFPSLQNRQTYGCKVMPSDSAWPSLDIWDAFNASVDGRLIKTVPTGSPCHYPDFNEEQCEIVRDNWGNSSYHVERPAEIINPTWLNKSCDPFGPPDSQCIIGNYAQYSVDVAIPEHIALTGKFAKDHDIRLVIKNTGHDLMGRSTGAGSLAIWTHNLQDIEILDYQSANYTGKALRAGAGVLGYDLEIAAHEAGLMAVAGQCPTVGFVGGYLQGGGQSLLSSKLGMGADQVLSWQVVTTEGDLLTASPTENEDLYWALSGGGPGTYGIVYEVTVKVFEETPFATVALQFNSEGVDADTFYAAAAEYWAAVPSLTDAGAHAVSILTADTLNIPLITAPDIPLEQLEALVAPVIAALEENGINYTYSAVAFDNYFDMYSYYLWTYEGDVSNTQHGGRIMPKSLWEDEDSFQEMVDVFRTIAEAGIVINQFGISPTLEVAGNPYNAVVPAWRDNQLMVNTVITINETTTTEEVYNNWDLLTNEYDPLLKAITPGGGAYSNEANPFDPDWKEAFYGEFYERLLEIKDKYDPSGLLYGRISVGSDRWIEEEDGRLCPA